jgi:hypothetical protein
MPSDVLSREFSSDDLCPPVYIRTDTSTWQEWNVGSEPELVRTIDTDEEADPFRWMYRSIRSYILNEAKIIPDDDSEACLDKQTLYWAVIHDSDFQAGDELELNNIGRTQVYVGRTEKGINERWLAKAGHCKKMMKCLKDIRRMKEVGTFEPLLLKDVQLVQARLVLAKLRANENSALFVMQTFGHDIEEAEKDFQSAQSQYDEHGTKSNKKNLDKAKKNLKNAKEKAKDDLIETESQNIQGMRISRSIFPKESNYIIQDTRRRRVRPRWKPLDMRYGMNSRK